MQSYTSANTSVNKAKLPAVYRRASLSRTTPFLVDYGCGKYTEHIRKYLFDEKGKILYPYDPYNQPEYINEHTMNFVRWAIENRIEIDVVCSNVLNVIDDDGTILFITNQIQDFVRYTGGTGYVTVYEGDRTGNGRRTGADQYQRNEPLQNYLKWFNNATIKNNVIIVKGE